MRRIMVAVVVTGAEGRSGKLPERKKKSKDDDWCLSSVKMYVATYGKRNQKEPETKINKKQ